MIDNCCSFDDFALLSRYMNLSEYYIRLEDTFITLSVFDMFTDKLFLLQYRSFDHTLLSEPIFK